MCCGLSRLRSSVLSVKCSPRHSMRTARSRLRPSSRSRGCPSPGQCRMPVQAEDQRHRPFGAGPFHPRLHLVAAADPIHLEEGLGVGRRYLLGRLADEGPAKAPPRQAEDQEYGRGSVTARNSNCARVKLACAGQALISPRCSACSAGCMRTTAYPPESRWPRSPPAGAASGEPPPGAWRRGSPWPGDPRSAQQDCRRGHRPFAPASATPASATANALVAPRRSATAAHSRQGHPYWVTDDRSSCRGRSSQREPAERGRDHHQSRH